MSPVPEGPGRTIGALRRDLARRLADAGMEAPELEARLLLAEALGCPVATLLSRSDEVPDPAVIAAVEALLARRVAGEPVARLLGAGAAAAPGRERGMVRETVFEAPMREGLWVLRDELRDALRSPGPAPTLLDGRADGEYWGETARAPRTGHLPGAISLPAVQLRAALEPGRERRPVLPQGPVVAYAHDAFEGLAYLSLLAAGHGVAARIYPEGWAEWAADGALPADAAGYPERGTTAASSQALARAPAPSTVAPIASAAARPGIAWPPAGALLAAALALVLAAFAGGWWLAGRRAAR